MFPARAVGRWLLATVLLGGLLLLIDEPEMHASATTLTGPVVGAVGDMACDPSDPKYDGGAGTATNCAQSRTSNRMLADTSLDAILALGDFQYDCDDPADFAVSYDPTWGRLDDLMYPTPGNHEYKAGIDKYGAQCPVSNRAAQGYFDHFGAVAHQSTGGHFSFNLGSWHLTALNANCGHRGVGGCSATSAQTQWLKNDLAATTQPCIAAFWHQPLFTGLRSNVNTKYRAWWNVLRAADADVVLNGHVHNYQRFAPRDPDGTRDVAGITEYVVGTGGEAAVSVSRRASIQPQVWFRAFGYLRMHLLTDGWRAEFIADNGTVLDTSNGTCHA